MTGFLVERRKAFKGVGLGIVPLKPLTLLMFEGIVKFQEVLHTYVHKGKKRKIILLELHLPFHHNFLDRATWGCILIMIGQGPCICYDRHDVHVFGLLN